MDAISDVLIDGIHAFHYPIIEPATLHRDASNAEDDLADLFGHASVPLHSLGPDGTILRANRAELEMLGYRQEEYVGQPVAKFHVDDRGPTVRKPVIKDILARVARGETVRNRPARMRCKDGSIRDVLISSSGLFRNGRFVHSRCVTLDVTERRDNEKRLEALSEELQRQVNILLPLLRALPPAGVLIAVDPEDQRRYEREIEKVGRRRREHLATLSMELRNAMAAIQSANKTIKPKLPPDSVLKQAGRMIDRQLRHVIRLLDRKLPLNPDEG